MKTSSQKTIIFETEIIKLCMQEEIQTQSNNFSSMPKVERSVAPRAENVSQTINTNYVVTPNKNIETTTTVSSVAKNKEETSQKAMGKSNLSSGNSIADWPKAVGNLKKQGKVMLYANLINTDAIMVNDMTVAIRFNSGLNAFRKDLLKKPENFNVLNKEIAMLCGKPMELKFEDGSVGSSNKAASPSVTMSKPKVNQENIEVQPQNQGEPDDLSDLDIPINFVEEE